MTIISWMMANEILGYLLGNETVAVLPFRPIFGHGENRNANDVHTHSRVEACLCNMKASTLFTSFV